MCSIALNPKMHNKITHCTNCTIDHSVEPLKKNLLEEYKAQTQSFEFIYV